jgi:hypothetical protein
VEPEGQKDAGLGDVFGGILLRSTILILCDYCFGIVIFHMFHKLTYAHFCSKSEGAACNNKESNRSQS